jgi:hypothetical protein
MYRKCATLSNTLLAWGRLDQFQFFEPASRLLVQLNVREYGRRKIANTKASLMRLKEVHNVYKNACATLSESFCYVVHHFSPLVNQPVVLLVQLNVHGRREDSNGLGHSLRD